jgi:hypothetical protein
MRTKTEQSIHNNLKIRNIGFISTRFQGTDGVSLEAEK